MHSCIKLSEIDFSAEDLDNISTDPHVNHSVIPARGADKTRLGRFISIPCSIRTRSSG